MGLVHEGRGMCSQNKLYKGRLHGHVSLCHPRVLAEQIDVLKQPALPLAAARGRLIVAAW